MASNLEQDLFKKTVVELKAILREGGQSTTGTKPILIQRIIENNLYTPPPPAVAPTHIIAPAGQPVYEPVPAPDEALHLPENLLAFILDHFSEEDFEAASHIRRLGWSLDHTYEHFKKSQAAELAGTGDPRITEVKNKIGEIERA